MVQTKEYITMLGTGAAMVTTCYNTCFTISSSDSEEHMLVDGGGGNGLLVQLEKVGISPLQIHNVFVSHNHSDHILGVVWLIRAVAQHINKGRYEGDLNIYAHPKSLDALQTISKFVMQSKLTVHFGNRIKFNPIGDKTEETIDGREFKFFDIRSVKELQHGFTCRTKNGKKLTFLGDEPYNDSEEDYAKDSDLLMQESYCMYADVEKFHPYEKHHGTALDSCRNAEKVMAKATLLFHTEGKTPMAERKENYTAEGKTVYSGTIYVPNDLEIIEI